MKKLRNWLASMAASTGMIAATIGVGLTGLAISTTPAAASECYLESDVDWGSGNAGALYVEVLACFDGYCGIIGSPDHWYDYNTVSGWRVANLDVDENNDGYYAWTIVTLELEEIGGSGYDILQAGAVVWQPEC